MSPIEWLSSFETGHEEIDRQHRQLVDAVAALEDDLSAEKFAAANARCHALRGSLQRHFEYEERLLIDLDFPRFIEHVETHAAARRKVEMILSDCREDCPIGLRVKCTARWYAAFLDHLLLADLNFKSHLEERGIVPRRQ